MPRLVGRLDPPHVADVAAAVDLGVGVEGLAPAPGVGQADPQVVVGHGGQVGHHGHRRVTVGAVADERQQVGVGVVGVDPLEGRRVVVAPPEGRQLPVHPVGVTHQVAHPRVGTVEQRWPVELAFLRPLPLLGDLATHEQQLLSGVAPHPAVQRPEVGEPLPAVAGHLADQAALAVDDLVVGQRQHEVFAPRIHHPEGQLVVVPAPVDGLLGEVRQRVVHPAHVPLEPEPQAAEVGGA